MKSPLTCTCNLMLHVLQRLYPRKQVKRDVSRPIHFRRYKTPPNERSIVGCNMLRTFNYPVATCWVVLVFKCSTFSCKICECCMMLYLFGLVRATMQRQGMRTTSICNTQHVATHHNRVAKRTQHVNFAISCIERL